MVDDALTDALAEDESFVCNVELEAVLVLSLTVVEGSDVNEEVPELFTRLEEVLLDLEDAVASVALVEADFEVAELLDEVVEVAFVELELAVERVVAAFLVEEDELSLVELVLLEVVFDVDVALRSRALRAATVAFCERMTGPVY